MATCTEEGCAEAATVRLYIPWDDDREVCLGHARVWAQKDGVVADPLEAADEELP
jgi:hypothetical protein